MRNLFFALVLANLAFAAWTAWYAESPGATPVASASASAAEGQVAIRLVAEAAATAPADEAGAAGVRTAGLRGDPMSKLPESGAQLETASGSALASEPEPESASAAVGSTGAPVEEQAAALASAPAAPGATDDSLRCFAIGPFDETDEADAAFAALESAGYSPARRSDDIEVWVGFWVHIDAISSREEANAMLAQLRDNGLPEAYLIPGEEDGDIISLGVFNNMTRAGRLEEDVRQIGLEPLIVERSRPGVAHWLDVSVPAGGQTDFAALGIEEDAVEPRACDASAG